MAIHRCQIHGCDFDDRNGCPFPHPERRWEWTREHAAAGGVLHVDDTGLRVEPEDDFYSGVLPPAEAVELARAILRRFG